MSTHFERVIVMKALARAEGRALSLQKWVLPYEVARDTAEFVTRTAAGGRVAFGERRTRRILAELVDDGLVRRRRSWSLGHAFQLTTQGRSELDG